MSAEESQTELSEFELYRDRALINGAWVVANSGKALNVTNPASLKVIGSVPNLGSDETLSAIDAASDALTDWRNTSAGERAKLLRHWQNLMLEHKHELATILTLEQGKPRSEALGEIEYSAGFLDWFAGEARRIYGDTIAPTAAGKQIIVQKEPVGVVAAITPWNFPSAMITRKVGAALAAGCTVVVKPSELTPFSALALGLLAERAGVPKGVLNIVTGQPQEIGLALTSDPRVRKLTFTGSTPVGKLLTEQCAPTLKRLSLELGGNAPFIVFDDADLDVAIDALMQSKFRNTGQTCVCANRILVQSGVYVSFVEKLKQRIDALSVGPGMDAGKDQGPLINQSAIDKVEQLITSACRDGAVVLTGGARLEEVGAGYFYAPTLLTGATSEMDIAKTEIFGPVAAVSSFETEADAVKLANASASGLAAYVATSDMARSFRLSRDIEVGMLGVNTGAISDPVSPFGGVKESGYGREGSKYGIEEYLEIRTMTIGGV